MPEGDTILRAARVLARVLAGKTVTAYSSRVPALGKVPCVGRVVTAVEAHGKNMLIRFDDGRGLHSHMGMHGSWHIYRPGERWRKSANLGRVVIEVEGFVVVCFSPQVLRFISPAEARRVKGSLGPDILGDAFDADVARRRLELEGRRSIGDALLLQRAVAGIGNVYKSEALFLTRTDPRVRVADLTGAEILAVVREARRLMRANVQPGSRMRTTRGAGAGSRYWVYRRFDAPCFTCGAAIARIYQGEASKERSTYFCPRCQARDTPAKAL